MLKLQNQVAGIPRKKNKFPASNMLGLGANPFQNVLIPEWPPDNPESADEDDVDEKLQVFVLKKDKHLMELEVGNVRRSGEFTLI